MSRRFVPFVIYALAVLALASCGEKPPRADPEKNRSPLSNATPQHPVYERTVQQGESERIGN